MYITNAQLGMTAKEENSQISILLKLFPLEIREIVPLGHHLKKPLPEGTIYPPRFVKWFKLLHWAYAKNNKKPITSKDGTVFNTTN